MIDSSDPGSPRTSEASAQAPDLQHETFTIASLSAEFGVSARTLRFYEEGGLISPRRDGLSRIYSRRDRARLAWIIRAKNVGFSLSEVRELLDLYDIGDGRVEQRRMAITRCREKVDQLSNQRNDLDAAIAELVSFVGQLETLELPQNR